MKNLILLIFFVLSLDQCAIRKNHAADDNPPLGNAELNNDQTDPPTTEQIIHEDQNPIPVDNLKFPSPPQESFSVEGHAFYLNPKSIDTFSGIQVTVKKTAETSKILSNQFKVSYTACPKFPDTNFIAPAYKETLSSCLEAYDRDLQFFIPVFSEFAEIKLRLCNEQTCDYEETLIFTNSSFLNEKSDETEMHAASLLVKIEQNRQIIYSNVAKIYPKFQSLNRYLQNCPTTLKASEKDQLITLTGLSQKALENLFLNGDLSAYLPLLSDRFISTWPTPPYTSKIFSTFSSLTEYVSAIILIGTSLGGFVYLAHSHYKTQIWTEFINEYRTIPSPANPHKKIVLVPDPYTGFLIPKKPDLRKIEPKDRASDLSYYLEDPGDRTPLKVSRAEDPIKIRDYKTTTWDQIRNFSGNNVGVFYKYGRYFAYDYNTKEFLYETPKGEAAGRYSYFSPNPKQIQKIYGGIIPKEYGLRRNFMGNVFDIYTFGDPNLTRSYFYEQKDLVQNKLITDIEFKGVPNIQEANYRLKFAHSYQPKNKGWFSYVDKFGKFRKSAIGVYSGTSLILGALQAYFTSKQDKDSYSLTNNETCSPPAISVKKELSMIGEARVIIDLSFTMVSDLLGFPVKQIKN